MTQKIYSRLASQNTYGRSSFHFYPYGFLWKIIQV